MTENSFAFRLKELLEHKNLSLQAVATELGVSRTAVHKWTKGGEIDYEKLRKLAAFLDVNWIWLRYGEQAQQELDTAGVVELPMTEVRRRYTAEVVASETRMKLAQEGARIVTWEWDLITDAVTYSSNVEAVYGWQVESNESFYRHVHPDDIPMMMKIYEESIRLGSPHEFDFRLIQPDGAVRWISSRATPLREFDGRVIKFVGISMENTARKLIERSLQEEQARFRAVFALAHEPIALLDGEWRCTAANEALAAWLGYPAGELGGDDLLTLFGDGGACVREAAQSASPASFKASLRHANGAMLPAQVSVRSERLADGSLVCVAVAIRG